MFGHMKGMAKLNAGKEFAVRFWAKRFWYVTTLPLIVRVVNESPFQVEEGSSCKVYAVAGTVKTRDVAIITTKLNNLLKSLVFIIKPLIVYFSYTHFQHRLQARTAQ